MYDLFLPMQDLMEGILFGNSDFYGNPSRVFYRPGWTTVLMEIYYDIL